MLTSTGNLGDVMKESAQAALSYLRTHCEELGIPDEFFEKKEIHIHIPEGAIPKDGPSAGVTMTVAMLSAIRRIGVPSNIGMTGEITLHGRILPIGGLTEKLLAAKRHRLATILIPMDNERDLVEIPDEIRAGLKIIPVKAMPDVLPVVFPRAFKDMKKK
jgi:ATP-dependent Lon protease